MELHSQASYRCSEVITKHYSTSFTLGIKLLGKKIQDPIYAIYGYVRGADEIVDTFHGFNKAELLERYRKETFECIKEGISLNPILHAFQEVVNKYEIDHQLIVAFLDSMAMDLDQKLFSQQTFDEYVYGSAEVVGLMCLKVFCDGDQDQYDRLKAPARSLGAAFQKINFLRDIQEDFEERGRVYFPGVDFNNFSEANKLQIMEEINDDFKSAYQGILNLPQGAKLGVYLAYVYYTKLFSRIKNVPASKILKKRIRVPDTQKFGLLVQTYFRHKFNFI